MHYLLFYDVVEGYVERRQPFRSVHLAYARRAVERGELVLGGALADPADGAVLLFRGDSPAVAEAFAAADPYVTNGLVRSWRVREWTTVVGAEAAAVGVEPYVTEATLEAKTRAWLEKIRPYNEHEMRLSADRSALLVVDMQEFFLDRASPTFACGGLAVVPTVKRLIAGFRAAGRPVIFTRHVHHPADLDSGIMGWWWEGKCLEGSPESEVHAELAPLPGEKVVFKHRYSAFYDTDLETVLRCLKVEDLVICGTLTNLCCESTARDAYYRDYRVFIPADGTGTMSEEMHLASLLNLAFGFAFVTAADTIVAQQGGARPRAGG